MQIAQVLVLCLNENYVTIQNTLPRLYKMLFVSCLNIPKEKMLTDPAKI